MAEGGFDLRQNYNFSDSESEGEDDRMRREVRERLFVFGLDRDVSPEGKDSMEDGFHSSQSTQHRDNDSEPSRTQESSDQSLSCSSLSEDTRSRRRSRAFSLSRLVRRLHRSRRTTDDAYREIEIAADGRGKMRTAGCETLYNSSSQQNESTGEAVDDRSIRQRPQSVVLRHRNDSNDRVRRRRPHSLIERARKFFDPNSSATALDGIENGSESLERQDNGSFPHHRNSIVDPDAPIRFPIGVNELVAIRRERARLRAEQTRIEYHIIPDILNITNCPWYWGKINRFEAEKVLEGQPDGTFLLRDSAQYHYLFSVSFRRYYRTYHARIEQWKHKYSFDKPSDFSFCSKSVCNLLEHYSQAEHCMYYEPLLLHPFPRKSALPLQDLCRAVIGNQITFQGVEELPLPKSLKLYLREYHYKVAVKKMEDKVELAVGRIFLDRDKFEVTNSHRRKECFDRYFRKFAGREEQVHTPNLTTSRAERTNLSPVKTLFTAVGINDFELVSIQENSANGQLN